MFVEHSHFAKKSIATSKHAPNMINSIKFNTSQSEAKMVWYKIGNLRCAVKNETTGVTKYCRAPSIIDK